MLSLICEGTCMAARRSKVGGLMILQRRTAMWSTGQFAHFVPTTMTQAGGVQDFRGGAAALSSEALCSAQRKVPHTVGFAVSSFKLQMAHLHSQSSDAMRAPAGWLLFQTSHKSSCCSTGARFAFLSGHGSWATNLRSKHHVRALPKGSRCSMQPLTGMHAGRPPSGRLSLGCRTHGMS